MESTLLPGSPPKALRIETSSSLLNAIEDDSELPAVEAAQLSPKVDRVRHHLIPARTTTCVRAPCLKRQVSNPISSISTDFSAVRMQAHISDRVASNPLPSSFAAPRTLALHDSRHVHFAEAPPEEFFVASGASYDRRPIKCTQGGSDLDMSLPPRCTSYDGDDSVDDDSPSTAQALDALEPADEPAPDVGFFQDPKLDNWACIKNGTANAAVGYQPRQQQSGLMASGKSLHFSALSSSQHASALASADFNSNEPSLQTQSQQAEQSAASQKVSLPVHGFRSFGGLQNSLAPEVTAVATTVKQQVAQSPQTTPPAMRKLSPDATPMPSPSLHKSLGAFTSVGYFGESSSLSQAIPVAVASNRVGPSRDSSSDKAGAAAQNSLGAMEVLLDTPATFTTAPTHDFRAKEPARAEASVSSSSKLNKLASINVEVPNASAQSTPRRQGLERTMTEKDAVRNSSLHPSAPASVVNAPASSPGWSGLLGAVSSPLSSRCSSVDPWSSLSSDGDGDCDSTESPGNENSWISSNCTSPDLSPFEQMTDSFHHKAGSNYSASSGSGSAWMDARTAKRVDMTPAQPNGPSSLGKISSTGPHDWDHELNTPKGSDFADEAKFSSSVETVNTTSWDQKPAANAPSTNFLPGYSNGDVTTSEATTPETSRRSSFHHQDLPSHRTSRRLRSDFGERDGFMADQLDDDESRVLRVRSLSRDGHAKKKSTKCRFCRSLRQRLKGPSTESSAPTSSGGSAQMTDAEGEAEAKEGESRVMASPSMSDSHDSQPAFMHGRDISGSTDVSEMEEEEVRSRGPLSLLRASVRSLSMDDWSLNSSRSRSRESSALSHLAISSEILHDRESSGSPGESCSESAQFSASSLPTMCTCDKKKEKERIKKKIRKERELERERDREWERDQARGRQKKLFGETFNDADNSCLSALDGF